MPELAGGVNVVGGKLTHQAVAHALDAEYTDPRAALGIA
jgi:alanine dehydrogenase